MCLQCIAKLFYNTVFLYFIVRVVTGVRFIKVKQMFHLQVEEGKLGTRGSINESTRHWVPVPGPEFSFRNTSLKNGVDYHSLTYDKRSIDLDSVIAPKEMVITGKLIFLCMFLHKL